ncbi:MAG: SBBP repeat-containing protein, partial [Bacteroidia bacterium]|nr:SBBP repeat-containing protein [Bacteroidia bacterium]
MKSLLAFVRFFLIFPLLFQPLFGQNGFIENKGQFINELNQLDNANFVLSNANFNLIIREKGFAYQKSNLKSEISDSISINQIQFEFIKPNKFTWKPAGNKKYINYFLGNKKFNNVPAHDELWIKNLWNGVDCRFSNDILNNPKYDFITPLKNLNKIKLQVNGIRKLEIRNDSIVFTSSNNQQFIEVIPVSYLKSDPNRKVKIGWADLGNNTIGFKLLEDGINTNEILIIDPLPLLKWATYFGGGGNDQGYCVASNSVDGHAYFGGKTSSTTTIASQNAHSTTIGGSEDGFLTKFHKEGGSNSKIWATYFGGKNADIIRSIAVDKSNNIIAVGETQSDSISFKAKFDSTYHSKKDIFIAKFNDNGQLIWSNYLGGSEDDIGWGVTCDSKNNIILVGQTYSDSLSINKTNYSTNQKSYNSNGDGFIAKFDSSGNILFFDYFGGSGKEILSSVSTGKNDTIYFVGSTNSNSLSSVNKLSKSIDAIIGKMSPWGSLISTIYYGDTGEDYANSIIVNDSQVFIAGTTNSYKGIAKNGHQDTINKGSSQLSTNTDAFLALFNSTLKLKWCTYYGGDENDLGVGVDLDDSNYVYLGGTTESANSRNGRSNIIATSGAFKTIKNAEDAFVVKFDDRGKRKWASYFGGEDNDNCHGISHGRFGDIYIVGQTKSDTNLRKRAYQQSYGTATDAYFADLYYCEKFALIKLDTACDQDTMSVFFTDSSNYFKYLNNPSYNPWDVKFNRYRFNWIKIKNGKDTTINSSNQIFRFKITSKDTGKYKLIVFDSLGCVDTVHFRVSFYWKLPQNKISGDSTICLGDSIKLAINSPLKDKELISWWKDSLPLNNKTSVFTKQAISLNQTGDYYFIITDSNECQISDTINILIGPIDSISPSSVICLSDSFKLQVWGNKITSIKWKLPNNDSIWSSSLKGKLKFNDTGLYKAFVIDSFGCKDTLTTTLKHFPISSLTIKHPDSVCLGESINLKFTIQKHSQVVWSKAGKTLGNDSILTIKKSTLLDSGFYKISTVDSNGCQRDTSVYIHVLPLPSRKLSGKTYICLGDSINIKLQDLAYIENYSWLSASSNQQYKPLSVGQTKFIDSGIYYLSVLDSNGCKWDTTIKIIINPLPKAKFNISSPTNCLKGNSFKVIDSSSISSGFIQYKSWYINGTLDSFGKLLNGYTFTSAGTKTVRLYVTSAQGCSHDTSISVTVYQNPTAIISRKDTSLCFRANKFEITDGGSAAATGSSISSY